MKALFIDPFGDALDLVMRAQLAEHDCVHFISQSIRHKQVGIGLTKVVREFKPFLNWADLIVLCDNVLYLDIIDKFRTENPNACVFGPTKQAALWETDRLVGMDVLQKHDISIPDFKLCSSYEDAVKYVKKYDDRLVCKPCGDADKDLSYVSKGPQDMLFMLHKWEKLGKLKSKFLLQEFIDGTEMGVSCYYGREGPCSCFEENFEHKKLMSGEIGPATGEMGTVLKFVRKSKLFDKVLKPLIPSIMKSGLTGNIDVNCIIDRKGHAWPLEFTCRMGYPALQISTPLFPDDPIQWMYDLAAKGSDVVYDTRIGVGVSVVIHPFPYPSYPVEKVLDFPIFGLSNVNYNAAASSTISPYHIQAGSITDWKTAGDYALVAIGLGSTIMNSVKKAYEKLSHIYIPGGMMYRDDIGEKVIKFLPELHKHGYALEFTR